MENASKALLIAASVLIGVLIMSLAIYLFTSFSGSVDEMNKQIEEGQLQQFNNQFTSYTDMEKDLTIYDVITIANLAIENNKYYELNKSEENNFYITVTLNNDQLQNKTEKELSKYLNEFSMIEYNDSVTGATVKKLKTYKCEVSFNENTGRVNVVAFSTKYT